MKMMKLRYPLMMAAAGLTFAGGISGAGEANVGQVIDGTGKIFANDHGMVVRKVLKAGENIERHNHEGEEIFFAVMSGAITVTLNDHEQHELKAGDVLRFNGKNFISAKANSDTVVVVNLFKE